jgi:hypothetical protein
MGRDLAPGREPNVVPAADVGGDRLERPSTRPPAVDMGKSYRWATTGKFLRVVPSQFDLDQSDPIILNADWHVPLSKIGQL